MKRIVATIGVLALLVFSVSCSKDVERAYWPTDEWQRATPESVGFSSEKLLAAISSRNFDAISIRLVIKNGSVILEAYRYRTDRNAHNVNSVTKVISPCRRLDPRR